MESTYDDLLDLFPPEERSGVAAVAAASAIAARETFGPFNDEEGSEFFQAEEHSPEQTWRRLAENVARAGARVVILGLSKADADLPLICSIHRNVFGELFPRVGGHLRGRNDSVTYGFVIGGRDQPRARTGRGTRAAEISPRLDDYEEHQHGARFQT